MSRWINFKHKCRQNKTFWSEGYRSLTLHTLPELPCRRCEKSLKVLFFWRYFSKADGITLQVQDFGELWFQSKQFQCEHLWPRRRNYPHNMIRRPLESNLANQCKHFLNIPRMWPSRYWWLNPLRTERHWTWLQHQRHCEWGHVRCTSCPCKFPRWREGSLCQVKCESVLEPIVSAGKNRNGE